MTDWQIGVAANLIVAGVYLAIFWAILRPLLAVRRDGLNVLGLATSAIFLTCAVHHGGHAIATAMDGHSHGQTVLGTPLAVWDVTTMAVGIWYWSLRRRYPSPVRGGQLFADQEGDRRRAAEQAALRTVAVAVAQERPRPRSSRWRPAS